MAGFVLKNTLSDNGSVTRGICEMDEQSNLTKVVETKISSRQMAALKPMAWLWIWNRWCP